MVTSAALYARISSDQTGNGLGVARQLEDCRRLCAARGWPVGQEYVDNDVSAFSGARRPAYEAMLADLSAGLRDAVVVYNLDRLTRRPIELEHFTERCASAGVRDLATVTADIDLGTDDGLLMARVVAAFAAKESAAKSRRMKRKYQQLAEQGLPHVSARAFGYEPDGMTIRQDEADIIRQAAERYLAGESLRGVATWLNDEGVPTVRSAPRWTSTQVAHTLTSPRTAGLREHLGQIVGPAVWPAILTPDERRMILVRKQQAARKHTRTPRRYLLSALLHCGNCNGLLFSSPRKDRRRYVCASGPDHGGCGRCVITAEPLEAWITEHVLARLEGPAFAAAVAARTSPDTAALVRAVESDTAQLDELATAYAERSISLHEWKQARDIIQKRLTTSADTLAAAQTTARGGIDPAAVRAAWPELGLPRQRAIIDATISQVVIRQATRTGGPFDPGRVFILWRA